MTKRLILAAALFMTCLTWNSAYAQSLKLGVGREGGQYYDFGRAIAKTFEPVPETEISLVPSSGSFENIQSLMEGHIDFAIVQDDIAAFLQSSDAAPEARAVGLRALVPLFPEYVQILVRRSPLDNPARPECAAISRIDQLIGCRVNVGELQSGTIRNATHVLQAHNLGFGDDTSLNKVIATFDNSTTALAKLQSGEVDAVFYTGGYISVEDNPDLQHLYLDALALSDLERDFKFYNARSHHSGMPNNQALLSVTAYLVTNDNVPVADVQLVLNELFTNWDRLRREPKWRNALPLLPNIMSRGPLTYHPQVKSELVRLGVRKRDVPHLGFLIAWFLICAASILAVSNRAGYNRLGIEYSKQRGASQRQRFVNIFARLAPTILGITLFLVLVIVAVVLLRITERLYIQENSGESAFLTLGWWDSFVWMFQYVASGFQGDAFAPKSDLGKLVAAAVAIIGVLGPITFILYLINAVAASRARKLKGLAKIDFENHLLICGWNEKGPGIVYSVTGDEVDNKIHVVIVADIDGISPIEVHQFDDDFVSFVRGDETQTATLRQANAGRAHVALILANKTKQRVGTHTAVLTSMNLSSLNADMHICAELSRKTDRHHFAACGCSGLIAPDLIVTKLAAAAIIDPIIIDFILDVVTYHEFDELYTIDAGDLQSKIGKDYIGRPLRDLEIELLKRGTNVIGKIRDGARSKGLVDVDFTEGGHVFPMTNKADSAEKLRADDVIVYSGSSRKSLATRNHHRLVERAPPIAPEAFRMRERATGSVLIIGDKSEALDITASLKSYNANSTAQHMTREAALEHATSIDLAAYSHIIVLCSKFDRDHTASVTDANSIDAETLVLVRSIQDMIKASNTVDIQLTAELLNIGNRKVMLQAGADAVVPTSLLIERLLVKEVFDPNHILDYLVALLNLGDGTHLDTMTIDQDHPLIGETWHAALKTEVEGLRIVGWLPSDERKRLKNKSNDYEYHFRTVLDRRLTQYRIRQGDILIVVYNSSAMG